MRENRPYGSEGGVAKSHPDPYPIYRSAPSAQCGCRLIAPAFMESTLPLRAGKRAKDIPNNNRYGLRGLMV